MVSTSRVRGTLEMRHGPSARRVAARIGSAAFLFPAGRIVPLRARPPETRNVGAMERGSYGAACVGVKRAATFAPPRIDGGPLVRRAYGVPGERRADADLGGGGECPESRGAGAVRARHRGDLARRGAAGRQISRALRSARDPGG